MLPWSAGWFSAGLTAFALFALLFALPGTREFPEVDGAIRCVQVYWTGRPSAGGNNHLLYFVNVFAWTRMLAWVGVKASNPFEFIGHAQSMNAYAAGAIVSIVAVLSYLTTRSAGAAVAAAAALAFSHAFMLHATSSAEPVVGLFWSLMSVAVPVTGLQTSLWFMLSASGFLLVLAMATYESMVLLGPRPRC